MNLRHISLLLLTGLAGVLSGVLWLVPNGLMAGALGMSLSAGTIWLGVWQERHGAPGVRHVLTVGLVNGLVAGALMLGFYSLLGPGRRGEIGLGPSEIPCWATILMGVLYGVVLHWSYLQRRRSTHPLRTVVGYAVGGCFLIKLIVGGIYVGLQVPGQTGALAGQMGTLALYAFLVSLLGAVPFGLLWTLITAGLDPAWSTKR